MAISPFADNLLPASGNPRDIDAQGVYPTDSLKVPWFMPPESSWLDYRVWVEVVLDAGMALHKPLPQSTPMVDTLASVYMGQTGTAKSKAGTNLQSNSQAVDVIQRMATSTYRFALRGYGLRAGYQIPVPGIKTIGGEPAIPAERQWSSGNQIVGNLMGGVPLFYCEWDLEYMVAECPHGNEPLTVNPALHIRSDAQLPVSVLLPQTQVDPRVNNPPEKSIGGGTVLPTFIIGGP